MVLLAAAMKNMQEPYNKNVGMNSNKGAWSPEEDQKLISYIMKYRIWNWNQIPKFAGLSRTGKSCRLRWVNYLRPDLKRGPFSMEEVETIIRMYQSLGNRWSAISKELPGRTDNEIKNFFHTHLKKQFGTKVNDHVQVKRKATCKKSKKAKELEMRTRGETQEKPNQSLDMSSSDITFDENHNWDFTNFSETSSEDNYCTVNSLVNQEAVPIIDSMVILESNPTTSENHDLYVQDFMDETSINSSNVDFWLELYMAAENLAG